ncbi:MAG: protein kinase, partial [Bifidobacteriaceae bacterium]|nr:protein kinase [Bifidobacteriaceae bacterium]
MGSPRTDPLIGRLIDGRYQVSSRIARGGMAGVYLARDRRLDRDVALKILHPHLADSAEFVERFRREARSAAKLVHPGIVGIYDQGTYDGAPYLVMEYVSGPTLREILATRGVPPLGKALDLMGAVLDALGAAHRSGIVHRDVKPENVLIGPDSQVKVADFGLARAVTEVTAASSGVVLGTVAYLSPELVGRGVADARTDVYSAGVMIYELLTGTQPFTGDVPIQIALAHVNSSVPPPSQVVPWLPVEVDELVSRLTAKDPASRPADGVEALRVIRKVRDGLDPAFADRTPAPPGAPTLAVHPPESGQPTAARRVSARERTHSVNSTGTQIISPAAVANWPAGSAAGKAGDSSRAAVGPQWLQEPAGQPPPDRTARPSSTGSTPTHRPAAGQQKRGLSWGVGAAIVLAVALIVGGATWAWYMAVGPGSLATAPDVAGKPRAEAEELVEAAGLRSAVIEDWSDDAGVGAVVSADPPARTRLAKQSVVT